MKYAATPTATSCDIVTIISFVAAPVMVIGIDGVADGELGVPVNFVVWPELIGVEVSPNVAFMYGGISGTVVNDVTV